ncbi:MotA/TolQ/ExbB proton channel family protein [Rubripirellula sp.]|nr:MotA/TolQ/ExbB proton channel family protein [Rubripirellula sp.]MDB4749429.1 MotA/TolQ/ExbB proton channel family protein [Rubripirellula sp.]
MTQSFPQHSLPKLRLFLILATACMLAIGVVPILPANTNSHTARAQTAANELLQPEPATKADSSDPSGTEKAAENAGNPENAGNAEPDESTAAAKNDGETTEQTDDDTESETAADDSEASLIGDFFLTPPVGYLFQGGLFMWPILIMGIIGAGVIIERYRSLNMLSGDSKQLRTDVESLLETNQVREAFELCNEQQGPVPAILATGLRKYLVLQTLDYEPAKIEEQVVKSMDDYSVHIVAALERHLPILATISSAAPMLGFLGTVQGMIVAFDDIVAKMGETNIVEAAAVGIKVSLMTTCFGLIVGIPAFVAFNYFTGIINRFVLDVEESATEMIEAVTLQTAITTADNKKAGETQQ